MTAARIQNTFRVYPVFPHSYTPNDPTDIERKRAKLGLLRAAALACPANGDKAA